MHQLLVQFESNSSKSEDLAIPPKRSSGGLPDLGGSGSASRSQRGEGEGGGNRNNKPQREAMSGRHVGVVDRRGTGLVMAGVDESSSRGEGVEDDGNDDSEADCEGRASGGVGWLLKEPSVGSGDTADAGPGGSNAVAPVGDFLRVSVSSNSSSSGSSNTGRDSAENETIPVVMDRYDDDKRSGGAANNTAAYTTKEINKGEPPLLRGWNQPRSDAVDTANPRTTHRRPPTIITSAAASTISSTMTVTPRSPLNRAWGGRTLTSSGGGSSQGLRITTISSPQQRRHVVSPRLWSMSSSSQVPGAAGTGTVAPKRPSTLPLKGGDNRGGRQEEGGVISFWRQDEDLEGDHEGAIASDPASR